MSEACLRLRFISDDDGTGKLLAVVAAGEFAGAGGAYFSEDSIVRFAAAIAAFPIPSDPKPSLAGGFSSRDGSGEIEQEQLSIVAYPVNARGHIGLQVRLADESWQHNRPEEQRRVQVEIVTTYEPLARFSRQIQALIQGSGTEAVLEGDLHPS